MIEHSAEAGRSAPDAPAAGFGVRTTWVDRILVLSVGDPVDALTAPVLTEAIGAAFAQSPAGVVVDLSAVDFLASAGMNVLVAAQRAYGATGRFAVVADGPATSRPIKLLGLDKFFALYRTLDDALLELR
jgi:anti-sigma B factor antagonist